MGLASILAITCCLCLVRSQDSDWKKPFIRFEPEDAVVSKGDSIELQCYVYGQPIPDVTWFKDGVKLYENKTEGRIMTADKTLIIRKARRSSKHDDTGVYQCVAKNEVGSSTSRNATVTVRYLSKIFHLNPQNATVNIHDNYLMKCEPPGGFPNATVDWLHGNAPLQEKKYFVEKVAFRGLPNAAISFNRVSWSNRGTYTCVAQNSEGKRVSLPAILTVKVIKPDLYSHELVIETYVGKSIQLQCLNRFEPQPVRTWSKVGDQMPEASRVKYQMSNSVLLITKAKHSDSGQYVCVGKNEAGENTLTLKVIIYEKPVFQVQPINVVIGRGKTATFECSVAGGKNTKIAWFYDTDYYDQAQWQGNGVNLDANNNLVIKNTDISEPKVVHCIYTDEIVKDQKYSMRATLTVIDTLNPPPIVKVLPTILKFEKDNLILPCTVNVPTTNRGKLQIKWVTAKDNMEVNDGATNVYYTRSSNSVNLTINGLLTSESGGYRCMVNSSSGTASGVTMVSVKPLATETPPKVLDLNYKNVGATSVTLTWTRPKTAILTPVTSYVIKIKNIAIGTLRKEPISSGTVTQFKITKLIPSATYSFTINAFNKMGEGETSFFPNVETLVANGTPDPTLVIDKLEDVHLEIKIGIVNSDRIEVKWQPVAANRITGYTVFYKEAGKSLFIEVDVTSNTATNHVLHGLKSNTEYVLKMVAVGFGNRQSKESPTKLARTLQKMIRAAENVYIEKYSDNNMIVGWTIPAASMDSVAGIEVTIQHSTPRQPFKKQAVDKTSNLKLFEGFDASKTYYVTVALSTYTGKIRTSKEIVVHWGALERGGRLPFLVPSSPPSTEKKEKSGFGAIVKEPWFIACVGVFVWLILLVIVVVICCRKRKKNQFRGSSSVYESRGLLPGHGSVDYPNTSLNRSRMMHDPNADHNILAPKKKSRKCCACCRPASGSSLEEDFPNRADIKPFTAYNRHESFEMRQKGDGMGMGMKENNVGIAMRNGYMVGAPLNNERNYRQNSIEHQRPYTEQPDRMKATEGPPNYRDAAAVAPGSGSLARRHQEQPKYKMDSVERRLGEIVRTNKQAPEMDVNVMATNPQASWKREKHKNSPTLSPKPPGENTLRRQGKTQFKPLPKLEVLNWADGLPNTSHAPSTNDGSPPGSPKTSSAFSEADNNRTPSRMSHGGSNNSLNKYSSHRRRRNSNASSMMSSELYQSEMDPSGYSDIGVSEKKKKKEKAIPPPIDFDGLTSDILLQWAESVTNSSPSSSGSSSPSRLSGISSEGSLYTDEDFASAVAAVAECGGFNMDYDYNLPGMNAGPAPLSSTRNSKMNKIDQVLAQRQKVRNAPPVPGSKPGPAPTPQGFPQISMSSYLTGSSKGPQSAHSGSSGLPRQSRQKEKNPTGRYGSGFDDVSSSSKPLTMSNLMKHDSSLDRGKKESTKPLTVSNLRNHETSLDRERRSKQQPITYDKPPPYEALQHNTNGGAPYIDSQQLLPEAPSLVTSALERHESMNSNSKDSVNSSHKHDSEVENNSGTSERKQQRKGKKYYVNNRDPQSSTSTVSTVRTSPENDEEDFPDC